MVLSGIITNVMLCDNLKKRGRVMKRRISLLFTVLLTLCFVLAGCGSKQDTSAVEGTWTLVSATEESSGTEISGDLLEAAGLNNFGFEFKSDGTVIATMGTDTPMEGTYTLKDNTVTVIVDDMQSVGEIDGSKMTMEDSDITIVLEKQQ